MIWLSKLWLNITKPAELLDWLGDGAKPVLSEEAERRSKICLNCPNNRRGFGVVESSAAIIKKKLGLKNKMEAGLDSCLGCGCYLPLKVWVPYEHIKAWQRTPELEACRKANPNCWQI